MKHFYAGKKLDCFYTYTDAKNKKQHNMRIDIRVVILN